MQTMGLFDILAASAYLSSHDVVCQAQKNQPVCVRSVRAARVAYETYHFWLYMIHIADLDGSIVTLTCSNVPRANSASCSRRPSYSRNRAVSTAPSVCPRTVLTLNIAVEEAAAAFLTQLETSHSEYCPWRNNPSPSHFTHLPHDQSKVLEHFSDRFKTFQAVPLPALSAQGEERIVSQARLTREIVLTSDRTESTDWRQIGLTGRRQRTQGCC